MKWLNIFVSDGKLKRRWKNIFAAAGIASAYGAWYFIDNMSDMRFWFLTIVAIVFGYGSSWAGLMEKWGYKPFTNDPLDWRKAKESYKENEAEEALNQSGDASAEDSKK